MNKIINNFLLAGGKFISEMHLNQPGFTSSACWPINKNKEQIQTFKETGDSRYIYQNEPGKSLKILKIGFEEQLLITYYVRKHLILLKTQNMVDIDADWLDWFIKVLIKSLLALILQEILLKVELFQTKN